jgi:hypothetical protein
MPAISGEAEAASPLVTKRTRRHVNVLYGTGAITMESLDVDAVRIDPTTMQQWHRSNSVIQSVKAGIVIAM